MDELQREIDAKAVAPRITPDDIESNIVSEHYFKRMLRFLFHQLPSLDWYFRSCAAAKQGTR